MLSNRPRPVDFEKNVTDQDVGDIGEAGWHTRAIAEATGLTPSQVLYRLRQAGVKRANYRNGDSDMAKIMLQANRAHGNERKEYTAAEKLYNQIDNLHERRSEEHTSELQSLMRISYAVLCLKKKTSNV